MPGKHLEFVKSGRYVVPVEIFFLPTSCRDGISGKETLTSKWAVRSNWKEIKALLKPAIDACTNTSSEGMSTSPHISYGQEVGLGYVLCKDSIKERSPFIAVLDSKKNCWTDDEDDFGELDELYAGLRDHGASYRSHVPTKIYVKAAVIKKTSSTVNDSKKLKKELGFKGDDLRSYFQNTSPSGSSSTLTSSLLHDKDWIESRSKRFGFGSLVGGDTGMDKIGPFMSSLPRRFPMERQPAAGTYYEEQDDDEDSDDGYKEVDLFDDTSDVSDDDNFSLPDIDAPQADIQLKQLKKETARKEQQNLKSDLRNNQASGKPQRNHKHETPARPRGELWEPRKTIQLVNPASDQFAHKLGAVLVTSPLKASSNIARKTKKRSGKEPAKKGSTAKKLKESKLLRSDTSDLPVSSAVGKSNEELENIPENLLGSSAPSPTKKVRKRKYTEEGRATTVDEQTETTDLLRSIPIHEKAKSKKTNAIPPRHSKRLYQDQEEEAGTAPTAQSNKRTDDEDLPTSDTETTEKTPKKKKKTKKASPASAVMSPIEEEQEVEVSVKKPKKRRRVTLPSLTKIKTEKSPNLVDPSRFEAKELGLFSEVDLLGLVLDPAMPVLSPEVELDEAEEEEEEPPPPKKRDQVPPKKKKKKKVLLFLPKKSKKREKSASTQTGRDDNGAEGTRSEGEDGGGQVLVPVDMEAEARRKLTENFMQDDETVGENRLAIADHAFLKPASMMPPPSRPAPRSPKKDFRAPNVNKFQQRPNGGRGFLTNPLGPGNVSDPSKLSTMQLMCNPRVLRAGFGLLNTLSNKKMSAVKIGNRMGFRDLRKDGRRDRELSPDITSLPTEKKRETEEEEGRDTDKPQSDEELSDNDHQEEGESLIRELLDRVHANSESNYEPEGDGYDLSQKSMCYLKLIPGYSQKSRLFKIHCKKVTDLTFEKLLEHYLGIRPALRQIFEGEVANVRSNTYLQGPVGIKRLQELSVSIPFDHDQTSSIITLLLEYFIPDSSQRPKWSDYISYVLLPEALINIYARVNEIPYDIAEKEMRFQGCYDDAS